MKSKSKTSNLNIYVLFIKPVIDFVISLLGTVFLLVPVYLIIWIIYTVKSDSGNIFFTQKRLGLNGEPFNVIKFRSMVQNAEEVLKENKELYIEYIENSYKLPPGKDPRLTVIGEFIRKTSIDEIPQFINILKGEMSFIGPRPILPEELNEYKEDQKELFLSVKPGATGWWQVSGRSDVMYPERCELELYYVHNLSWKLDLKIIWLTIIKVLLRNGAH